MARGPKKHMKRLNAPKHWMLDKLGGVFATRPRAGPHRLLESLPLSLVLRNKLKYALTGREISMVIKQRTVEVDGRPRTDSKYPAGFMDVITIPKTKDRFRLLYDVKGRFVLHKIAEAETTFKVCRVSKVAYAPDRTPFIATHDGRTIRYADPNIREDDSVVVDLKSGKVREFVRFKPGALAYVTGGANRGRIGEIVDVERHPGSFDIVHIKDAQDHTFATRKTNVFVIGASTDKPLVSLPKLKGVKPSLVADREKKIKDHKKK
jgi:small subunit ribosomal protein S4e